MSEPELLSPTVKMGRKTNETNPRHRVNIMVSNDTLDRLRKLGHGNISEGVRAAAMGRTKPYVQR